MLAPILYEPSFVDNKCFDILWNELPWERRSDAPRRECWMNDWNADYTYGKGAGIRTYTAKEWNPLVLEIRSKLMEKANSIFEGCFINGYEGPRDHLGWHADDSPEIDDNRPIAVISLGSARNIWFREKGSAEYEVLTLEPGSLLLMKSGMQSTHEHRIPKHGANCGARISLTFRGLNKS